MLIGHTHIHGKILRLRYRFYPAAINYYRVCRIKIIYKYAICSFADNQYAIIEDATTLTSIKIVQKGAPMSKRRFFAFIISMSFPYFSLISMENQKDPQKRKRSANDFHHKQYQCKYVSCSKRFFHHSDLKRHLIDHRTLDHRCPDCSESFFNQHSLNVHKSRDCVNIPRSRPTTYNFTDETPTMNFIHLTFDNDDTNNNVLPITTAKEIEKETTSYTQEIKNKIAALSAAIKQYDQYNLPTAPTTYETQSESYKQHQQELLGLLALINTSNPSALFDSY